MPRYIDADLWEPYFYEHMDDIHMVAAKNALDDMPAADVVPVVRCRDCRCFVESEWVCKLMSNNYEPPVYVEPDDFCSRGERREYA